MSKQQLDDAVDAQPSEDRDPADDHLEDLDDGCGCVEVWEHRSEEREE